jgi:hypothetical protein
MSLSKLSTVFLRAEKIAAGLAGSARTEKFDKTFQTLADEIDRNRARPFGAAC